MGKRSTNMTSLLDLVEVNRTCLFDGESLIWTGTKVPTLAQTKVAESVTGCRVHRRQGSQAPLIVQGSYLVGFSVIGNGTESFRYPLGVLWSERESFAWLPI